MTSDQTNVPHRPPYLHQLLEALQREHFYIRPDDYVEMENVLSIFKPEKFDQLKSLIAPLIVTSEAEQEKFDKIFDVIANIVPASPLPPPPPPPPNATLLLWVTGVILTVGFFILSLYPAPTFRPDIHHVGNKEISYEVGDTLVFEVDSTLGRAAGPQAKWEWLTPDSARYANRSRIQVVASEPGILRVQLKSQYGRGYIFTNWTDSLRSLGYPICKRLPKVAVDTLPSKKIYPDGLKYKFIARQNEGPSPQVTQWLIDGKVVASNSKTLEHNFKSGSVPVTYIINFRSVPDTNAQLCFTEASIPVTITPTAGSNFTLSATSFGKPLVFRASFSNSFLATIIAVVVLIVILTGFYWGLLTRKRREKRAQDGRNAAQEHPLPDFLSDEPPYEIPFENRDSEIIVRDQNFYQTVRTLRQSIDAERRVLNIGMSLDATLREGGIPTLIFKSEQTETEYLFLIEKRYMYSQQTSLFNYLWKTFVGQNVCAERFFFDQSFNHFTNEMHPKSLSLSQLKDRYKHCTLLIWSDGQVLLNSAYPVLEMKLIDIFFDWPARAILTPVPFSDWGVKERALQSNFLLIPTDVSGQLQLIQALTERLLDQSTYLSQNSQNQYSVEYVNFDDIDELREFTGNALFQWVAAIAIYPRMRWEILVEFGQAILPAHEVNFSNILKLVRIKWIREGSMPDRLRLELLKSLSVENELKVRERLLEMLDYSTQYFDGEHFYDEEKFLVEMASQFVLYRSNPVKYTHYKESERTFQKLYQNEGYPDRIMLQYLENVDFAWQTPVSVFMPDQEPKLATDKSQQWIRRTLVAAMGTLTLVLTGIFYQAGLPENKVLDADQLVQFTMVVDAPDCAANTPVDWILRVNDSLFRMNTGVHQSLSFPYRQLMATTNRDSMSIALRIVLTDTTFRKVDQYATAWLTGDSVRVQIKCPALVDSAGFGVYAAETDSRMKFACSAVPNAWLRKFHAYQQPGNNYNVLMVSDKNAVTIGMSIAAGSKSNSVSYGTISSICASNGYYLVLMTSANHRSMIVDKRMSKIRIASATVDIGRLYGDNGQTYFDELVRNASFVTFEQPGNKSRVQAQNPGEGLRNLPSTFYQRDSTVTSPQVTLETQPGVQEIPLADSAGGVPSDQNPQQQQGNTRQNPVNDLERLRASGTDAFERGDYGAAYKIAEAVLNKVPSDNDALTLKGMTFFKQRNFEGSRKLLLQATDENPENAEAFLYLAKTYCATGNSTEANKAYNTAIEIDRSILDVMRNDKEFLNICAKHIKMPL